MVEAGGLGLGGEDPVHGGVPGDGEGEEGGVLGEEGGPVAGHVLQGEVLGHQGGARLRDPPGQGLVLLGKGLGTIIGTSITTTTITTTTTTTWRKWRSPRISCWSASAGRGT